MLDSQAFPHILEAVVDLAQPAALLALRACSRALRGRVDKRLFDHVEVIFPSEHRDIDVAVSPLGSHFTFEWLAGPPITHPEHWPVERKHAVREPPQNLARVVLRAYIAERMKIARVIDLKHIAYLASSGSQFALLQDFLDSTEMLKHTTLRVFGTPQSISNGILPMWTPVRECIIFDDVDVDIIVVERLVRALLCRPGDVAAGAKLMVVPLFDYGFSFNLYPYLGRKTVVIHLLHSNDPDPPFDKATASVVHQILFLPFLSNGHITPTFTVVGGSQECRLAVRLPSTASDDEFHAALNSIAEGSDVARTWMANSNSSSGAIAAHWREHLRFASPSSYATEVGSAQVALETQVDPTGVPARYLA